VKDRVRGRPVLSMRDAQISKTEGTPRRRIAFSPFKSQWLFGNALHRQYPLPRGHGAHHDLPGQPTALGRLLEERHGRNAGQRGARLDHKTFPAEGLGAVERPVPLARDVHVKLIGTGYLLNELSVQPDVPISPCRAPRPMKLSVTWPSKHMKKHP